jgi:lysozyme
MATNPTTSEAAASIRSTGKRRGLAALVIAMAVSAVGFEGVRLVPYDDGLGIATVCMGQTMGVQFGQPARTLEACSSTLLDRIQANQDALNRRIGPIQTPKGPISFLDLSEGEQMAYNSLYDNLGPGGKGVKDGLFALKSSGAPSTMMRLLREGKRWEACQQITQWLNPKWMSGIATRRQKELAYCTRDLKAPTPFP